MEDIIISFLLGIAATIGFIAFKKAGIFAAAWRFIKNPSKY